MYREFLVFAGIVVIALFMSIHNRNLDTINNAEEHAREHRIERDNLLMRDGQLIKVGNGVTFARSSDLIIISQAQSTIILNQDDVDEVIAFLSK